MRPHLCPPGYPSQNDMSPSDSNIRAKQMHYNCIFLRRGFFKIITSSYNEVICLFALLTTLTFWIFLVLFLYSILCNRWCRQSARQKHTFIIASTICACKCIVCFVLSVICMEMQYIKWINFHFLILDNRLVKKKTRRNWSKSRNKTQWLRRVFIL